MDNLVDAPELVGEVLSRDRGSHKEMLLSRAENHHWSGRKINWKIHASKKGVKCRAAIHTTPSTRVHPSTMNDFYPVNSVVQLSCNQVDRDD